jgi:DNA invertase Pin-like site-specific DNA recombinase
MTGADLLPATVLKRKAVVYVRQSTQTQVQTNLESQRRQYELVDEARRRGFRDVEVIDDDLGRSASGTMARPGFDRLVAWLCAGDVDAVLCFDASRLARNGRDWHHLLELCGLVGARVIDLDGIYDPCRPNDRLLLGMKGSISEFELGVLRARMYDAARSKARRGELRISVPVGYVWHREMGLGFDPDMRLQEAIRLIFVRFRELGSARQVLLSLAADQLHFPRPSDGKRMIAFDWTPIRYRNVISVLKNPFYAGAYIYGKSEHRTAIVNGRAQKTYGHGRPFEEWEVVIKDHHEGYIDWPEFERDQNRSLAAGPQRAGLASPDRAVRAGGDSRRRSGRRVRSANRQRPLYAGAYAFGRRAQRTRIVDGRAHKVNGIRKPKQEWTVLLRDHHAGYITWQDYEGNQKLLLENAYMKRNCARKSARGGRALLTGLMRCGRCGRMMRVFYGMGKGHAHRYQCRGDDGHVGAGLCIGAGGVRVDRAIALQLLEAVSDRAIEAAIFATAAWFEGDDVGIRTQPDAAARPGCSRFEGAARRIPVHASSRLLLERGGQDRD